MKLTKRDYNAIAKILNRHSLTARLEIFEDLANYFKSKDLKFSYEEFKGAVFK